METTEKLHIAIIPDGNRRWARERTFLPWKGHERAIENFRSLTEWCQQDPRVGILTVWCFSTENWKRDPEEIRKLMGLLESYLQKERKRFAADRTRLVHSGRKDRIPASLAKLIEDIETETGQYGGFTLHLAIDYGGKDEIIRAVNRMLQTAGEATNERTNKRIIDQQIRQFLDHPELPDIDLVIRTSGESRTSNFFLWQSAYAEWTFSPKHFPDFTTEDLAVAVDDFARRTRRFGA